MPYDVTAVCVVIGSNGTDLKIAIVAAAPAKVEMEEVVGIIAVAYKSVPTTVPKKSSISRIINGAGLVQLFFQHHNPNAVIFLFDYLCVIPVLGDKGSAGSQTIRTAFVGTVGHICSHTAIAYQSGHRIHLFIRRIPVKLVGHQVIAVGGVFVINEKITVIAIGISVRTQTVGRIFVVFDNLRHSCGHATGNGLVVVFTRTQRIVPRTLVPRGGEQRRHSAGIAAAHRLTSFHQFRPFRAYIGCCGKIVLLYESNLVGIALQPCSTVGGDVLRVETSVGGIAQHGFHCVVGGNDDEAAAYVIDIEQRIAAVVALGVGQRAFGAACHCRHLPHHKVKGYRTGLLRLHRVGHHNNGANHHGEKGRDFFHKFFCI